MWTIQRSNEEAPYYILPTCICRVGRQGCQIIVQDTTVSRHHADLAIIVENCSYVDGDRNTSLQLKDVSKFAQTSVNGSLLNPGQREVSLNPGDVIQFGACRDSFTVHYKKIVAYIADLNDRPELQSLAFRTGIPITDAIEYSDIFVCDEVDETNLKHIQAIAKHLPIISPEYLCKLADIQSGVKVLPPMRNFEIEYPNKQLPRTHLFRDMQFMICGPTPPEISSLILSCGGCTVDLNNLPRQGLVVIDSHLDRGELRQPVSGCQLIGNDFLLKMVYHGSTETLSSVPKVTIGPTRQEKATDVTKMSDENWIQSGGSSGKVTSDFDTSERLGTKRFKKRKHQNSSDSVELQVWDGKDTTRKRRDIASLALTERNDIDEWFDSYSTQ